MEFLTQRGAVFQRVGLENFSYFQFDFWSVWLHERLISTVLDLKFFRIFNLILGVYDATGGWFPLYWTWNFFLFSIWFLGSLTPREADFHREGLSDFRFFESMTPREAHFHRVGLEKCSYFQFDFWSVRLHERLISTVLDLKIFLIFNLLFSIFNLIFGVYDATRGWFPLCWTWKFVEFSIYYLLFLIWFLESFSDFQFYFWSVWLNERLFSNVLDLKNFRIFNLILWVYDATGGWFTLYWTWNFFLVFNVIFGVLESTRGWFLPWWNWKVFGFSNWFL